MISWYGRKDEGYADRGGRISFVDNNSCFYPYVYVLLVDADFCTLPNIHVDGVESFDGALFVVDSRKGANQILQFNMNRGLFEVPSSMRNEATFFGHRTYCNNLDSLRVRLSHRFFPMMRIDIRL